MDKEALVELEPYIHGIWHQINDDNYINPFADSTFSGNQVDFIEKVVGVLVYRIFELEERVEDLEERLVKQESKPDPYALH